MYTVGAINPVRRTDGKQETGVMSLTRLKRTLSAALRGRHENDWTNYGPTASV